MSGERTTIYVALMNEGIDVWRPVEARRIAPDAFLILDQDYDPQVETWQFQPGTTVRCRKERRNGRQILIATEDAGCTPTGLAAEGYRTRETPSWRGKFKISLVTCPICLYAASKDGQERGAGTDGVLSVDRFVKQRNIDPAFFDDLYYVVPDGPVAEETYAVLYESMRRKEVAALCRMKFDEEERQIAILPGQRMFRLYVLHQLDEFVQERVYFDQIRSMELDSEMISLAERLIDLQSGDFEPETTMVRKTATTRPGVATAVDEAIKAGKVIRLKDALEESVKFKNPRNAKSRNQSSGQ